MILLFDGKNLTVTFWLRATNGIVKIEADFTKKDAKQTPSNATNYDPETRKRLKGIFDPKERTIKWLIDGNHWRKIPNARLIHSRNLML